MENFIHFKSEAYPIVAKVVGVKHIKQHHNMIKSITIYKPSGIASFEVGAKLIRGDKETDITVVAISIGADSIGEVMIKLSDKSKIIFRGFPISYDE